MLLGMYVEHKKVNFKSREYCLYCFLLLKQMNKMADKTGHVASVGVCGRVCVCVCVDGREKGEEV